MPRTTTVTLGGKAYTVQELPIRASRRWRERASAPLHELVGTLEGVDATLTATIRDADDMAEAARHVVGVLRSGTSVLTASVDTMLDLLFAYSPALAEDRERIEEEAYTSEAVEAFTEVLKLAFPLSAMRTLFASNGRKG